MRSLQTLVRREYEGNSVTCIHNRMPRSPAFTTQVYVENARKERIANIIVTAGSIDDALESVDTYLRPKMDETIADFALAQVRQAYRTKPRLQESAFYD